MTIVRWWWWWWWKKGQVFFQTLFTLKLMILLKIKSKDRDNLLTTTSVPVNAHASIYAYSLLIYVDFCKPLDANIVKRWATADSKWTTASESRGLPIRDNGPQSHGPVDRVMWAEMMCGQPLVTKWAPVSCPARCRGQRATTGPNS